MSEHEPEAAPAPDHDAEDVRKHVRVYLLVFFTLGLLTAATVGVAYLDLPNHHVAIAIGLTIATIKASLVGLFFMHLISETRVIYWTLALTAIFFTALLALPVMTLLEWHPLG